MSEDPTVKVVKGVTEGVLSWTAESLKKVVNDLRKGNIKIVTDKETYDNLNNQKKLHELQVFKKYVDTPELNQLYQAGLALRAWETNYQKLNKLKTQIKDAYGAQGLHIAEFFQNGVFTKYLDILILREKTEKDIKNELNLFFEYFDKNATFVQETTTNTKSVSAIVTRINSNLPKTYIIFGSGRAAKKSTDIAKLVYKEIKDAYVFEEHSTTLKKVYFLNKEN